MINPEHAVNTDVYMQVIQTFVAVMYSRINSAETVDEGRLQFFWVFLHERGDKWKQFIRQRLLHYSIDRELYIKVL